jgi:hypothetical protein
VTLLSGLLDLPPTVEVRGDPVNRLLDEIDLALFSSTTVTVEAVARGIPVLHVKSDLAIDRNILECFLMVQSTGDPGEIREIALRILEHPASFSAGGRQAFSDHFTPIEEVSSSLAGPDPVAPPVPAG